MKSPKKKTGSKKFKLGPLQKKWLKALRSGKFRQGKGLLRSNAEHQGHPTYCCLGVANEVLGLGESNPESLKDTYKKLGLRCPYGSTAGTVYFDELTELNDSGLYDERTGKYQKMTFKKIADYIQKNASAYFKRSV